MICYRDRTFCGSKEHEYTCTRQITEVQKEHAKELGLPIAYSNFCS